jgi:hypothetical protein
MRKLTEMDGARACRAPTLRASFGHLRAALRVTQGTREAPPESTPSFEIDDPPTPPSDPVLVDLLP